MADKRQQKCGDSPCDYTLLDELIAELEGKTDSTDVLNVLKAKWNYGKGPLYKWFSEHAEERNQLVQFVQSKCTDSGMRTYDELNAIEFGLRYSLSDMHYQSALKTLNIRTTLKSAKGLLPYLGGGDWEGTYIGMDPIINSKTENSSAFHAFNSALIQSLTADSVTHPLFPLLQKSEIKTVNHLCVISDPLNDPTEDDAAALCALVAINRMCGFINKFTVLITGSPHTLDARMQAVNFIVKDGVSIKAAPVFNKPAFGDQNRFLSPFGDQAQAEQLFEQDGSYEKPALEDGQHVVDRIPDDTTALLLIGQVPRDMFDQLTQQRPRLSALIEVSMQAPGFNTMGIDGVDDIGAQIKTFLESTNCEMHWSDNKSGLMISVKDANARIDALSALNQRIKSTRSKCVASFWATSGKAIQFEGQFGNGNGYNYARDTVKMFKFLRR